MNSNTIAHGERSSGGRTFQLLECARLIAILSIVWLHTPESTALANSVDIGRFAVPFFTMASLFLSFHLSQRRPEFSIRDYFVSRFRRIYVVFVVWSLFYLVVRVLSAAILKHATPEFSLSDLLWNGTAHHLWFLPFIFVISVIGFVVSKFVTRSNAGYWLIVVSCLILCLALALNHRPNTFRNYGYTLELSVDALPSVFLGIALSMTYLKVPTLFNRPIVTATGLLLWIGCLALLLTSGRTILLETLSGLGLMIASLNSQARPSLARFAAWGSFSLGLYILHIFFLEGFQDIAHKLGQPATWRMDIITFLVTLLCSMATLLWVNKVKPIRWLLF